ncbi:MAG: hypothetical protein ACLVJH_19345 [Faecalibacterium prausnitzii]
MQEETLHYNAVYTVAAISAHSKKADDLEWSPLCSDHVQRKDYCLFTGLENLRIFQTCLFTRGVERESFSYKSNLHLKRRYKKAAAPDHEQRLRYCYLLD